MHGLPWKVDIMAIKFPSPKTTFQAFKSAFGAKPSQRPDPGVADPRVRTPFASDLPRRGSPAATWQAGAPPRNAAPWRTPNMPGHGRTQSAPFGAARPLSQGEKLLKEFKLAELDRMTDKQLAEVAAALEGRRHDNDPAATFARMALPFVHNWQLMRKEFKDHELAQLIAKNPVGVADMLKKPAAAPRPGPQPKPAGTPAPAPAPAPNARHQWNQTPPRAAGAAPAPHSKPGKPPISVMGLGRQAAIAELKARGITVAELKAMSQAFHEYASYGGDKLEANFKKTYGHLIADDITDSANRAKLALFFKGLMREKDNA